jgi:hypothetical protein
LIFGRLQEEHGLPEIVRSLGEARKLGFAVERVTIAMTLRRLRVPGSDL